MRILSPEQYPGINHSDQYGFSVPPNILPELILQSSVDYDYTSRTIGGIPMLFVTFEAGGRVPEHLAQAAHYLSNVDGTMVLQTEGDRARRFADTDDIQENFLGIRRLVAVANVLTGDLVALGWGHDVQGNKADVDLLDASMAGGKGKNVATHAFRVYHPYRDMGVGRQLVDIVLDGDFASRRGCKGSIIRVSSSRQTAGFFERFTSYSHLELPEEFLRQDGVNIMFAPNPIYDRPEETPGRQDESSLV